MAIRSRLDPSTGTWVEYRTPSINSSSGEVFDWRATWRLIRDAADEIKEDARQVILDAAERTATEAGPLYPVYQRKSTRYPRQPHFGPAGRLRARGFRVQEISRFRVRVTHRERYSNFVDSQPRRRVVAGKHRGTITPTPVIGRVATKWRAWMHRELQAIAERHAQREIG